MTRPWAEVSSYNLCENEKPVFDYNVHSAEPPSSTQEFSDQDSEQQEGKTESTNTQSNDDNLSLTLDDLLTLREAVAQGKFDDWAGRVYSLLDQGKISYREIYLNVPHLRPELCMDGEASTPRPLYSHPGTHHKRFLELSPAILQSHKGLLTYSSEAQKKEQQDKMHQLGIEEMETAATAQETRLYENPEYQRYVCKPSKLRNSWTVS